MNEQTRRGNKAENEAPQLPGLPEDWVCCGEVSNDTDGTEAANQTAPGIMTSIQGTLTFSPKADLERGSDFGLFFSAGTYLHSASPKG